MQAKIWPILIIALAGLSGPVLGGGYDKPKTQTEPSAAGPSGDQSTANPADGNPSQVQPSAGSTEPMPEQMPQPAPTAPTEPAPPPSPQG